MNTTMKVVTGILVGATAGIVAGILLAPNSGKKTREMLADQTRQLKDQIAGSLDNAKKAYNKEVEALVTNGKSGIDSLKNALKV